MVLSESIKKGGPYPKQHQEKRRDDVFRLHFEYGYLARAISDLMKINRNTINNDISILYSKMRTGRDDVEYDDLLNKQLYRLESQRVRLRKELDSDITLQERLQIEKIIQELDSKKSNMIIKLLTAQRTITDFSVKLINDSFARRGSKERYMSADSLYRIPEENADKIFELLNNEK